jgi:hypothetical protein
MVRLAVAITTVSNLPRRILSMKEISPSAPPCGAVGRIQDESCGNVKRTNASLGILRANSKWTSRAVTGPAMPRS